jgi:hypothetical protein
MFKERKRIENITLIGSWEDVSNIKASDLVKGASDEILDGIIVKGYEMKFGQKNENLEIYEKNCFDDFINAYFVENKLNMVVDRQHYSRDICGRVIYAESNSVGFYIVAYIPRRLPIFDLVKTELQEGLLQGFSKCGWATDYEFKYTEDGDYDYMLVKKMEVTSMSLVSTPANAIPFDRVQEIRNALKYENTTKSENKLKRMFNN